jgi:hypothetical protein
VATANGAMARVATVLATASPSTPAQRRPVAAVETMYSAQKPPASSARPKPRASTLLGPAPNKTMPSAARPTHTKSRGRRLPRAATANGPMNSIVTATPSGIRAKDS